MPFTVTSGSYMPTLIVWKDYNCQDWKNIAAGATETSTFTTAQKALIKAEVDKMTGDGIKNDVWMTAFTMMDNLQRKAEFSSSGYSVIMMSGTLTFTEKFAERETASTIPGQN